MNSPKKSSPDKDLSPLTFIDRMRQNYTLGGLYEQDVADDPMVQFENWFGEVIAKDEVRNDEALTGIPEWFEPNAMTLSTSTTDGHVTSRIVLLKGIESAQFVFFTNYDSIKSQQISVNPNVSLCFFWPHLQRQVLVSGRAARISRDRSQSYFHSRPRESQLGAHASTQSAVVESREVLEQRMQTLSDQYPPDTTIPLPDNWGGFAVTPTRIEFWQGRTSRLHDRIVYARNADLQSWNITRLSP